MMLSSYFFAKTIINIDTLEFHEAVSSCDDVFVRDDAATTDEGVAVIMSDDHLDKPGIFVDVCFSSSNYIV